MAEVSLDVDEDIEDIRPHRGTKQTPADGSAGKDTGESATPTGKGTNGKDSGAKGNKKGSMVEQETSLDSIPSDAEYPIEDDAELPDDGVGVIDDSDEGEGDDDDDDAGD